MVSALVSSQALQQSISVSNLSRLYSFHLPRDISLNTLENSSSLNVGNSSINARTTSAISWLSDIVVPADTILHKAPSSATKKARVNCGSYFSAVWIFVPPSQASAGVYFTGGPSEKR